MVGQYPHTLQVSVMEASTRDSSGNWLDAAESIKEYRCRYEPNSGSVIIGVIDGKQIVYSGLVYLPLPADAIAVGVDIQVYDGAVLIASDIVKRYSKGQLNARLWL